MLEVFYNELLKYGVGLIGHGKREMLRVVKIFIDSNTVFENFNLLGNLF